MRPASTFAICALTSEKSSSETVSTIQLRSTKLLAATHAFQSWSTRSPTSISRGEAGTVNGESGTIVQPASPFDSTTSATNGRSMSAKMRISPGFTPPSNESVPSLDFPFRLQIPSRPASCSPYIAHSFSNTSFAFMLRLLSSRAGVQGARIRPFPEGRVRKKGCPPPSRSASPFAANP